MGSNNIKYKFVDTGAKPNFKDPQYSISYHAEKKKDNTKVSYNIISALAENKDIIIEINTSLFIGGRRIVNKIVDDFLSEIQRLSLAHYHRNIKVTGSRGFFSFLFARDKEEEAHEILVYVPNKIWKNNELYNMLPNLGLRYYIVDANTDSDEDAKAILDKMNILNDQAKIDSFSMIIFDISSCNQMGIMTKKYTAGQIKKTLGIEG